MMDERHRDDNPSYEDRNPGQRGGDGSGRGHGAGNDDVWDGVGNLFAAAWRVLTRLWREGSRRQLALRKPSGDVNVRLPLTIAVLIALFLLWRALPLLILAVILVFALRGSIVVLRRETGEG